MAILARHTLGDILLLEVDSNPNGVNVAPKGSLALDSTNAVSYINTNGATAWTAVVVGTSSVGWAIAFGGNMSSSVRYVTSNGVYNSPQQTSLNERTVIVAPFAGRLNRLTWSTKTADATTVMRLWKNGLVVETTTLTGPVGNSVPFTTVIAVGDRLALEFFSGTSPTDSTYLISVDPPP